MADVKGNLMSVLLASVIFLALGVMLSIGSDLLFDVGENLDASSVTNETVAITNNTPTVLTYPYINSITLYNNSTQGSSDLVPSSAADVYVTRSDDNTHIVLVTNASYPGEPAGSYYARYTYWDSYAYNSSRDLQEAIDNTSEWTPTLGTLVAGGAILAIIMASFVSGYLKRKSDM